MVKQNDYRPSNERSIELRAFADILRDTGRYGVDFADVERASLLSDAADELDRQRAEIERLTRELRLAESARDYANAMLDNVRSSDETKARRMTRAEADAMNRAFWRSVEIIDDIDDREEVAPGDARYCGPSEKAGGES